jgi:hypothetical protein
VAKPSREMLLGVLPVRVSGICFMKRDVLSATNASRIRLLTADRAPEKSCLFLFIVPVTGAGKTFSLFTAEKLRVVSTFVVKVVRLNTSRSLVTTVVNALPQTIETEVYFTPALWNAEMRC